jgi:hypothetical protein
VATLKIDRFGLSFHIGSNPDGQADFSLIRRPCLRRKKIRAASRFLHRLAGDSARTRD